VPLFVRPLQAFLLELVYRATKFMDRLLFVHVYMRLRK
jgi:hypothetical protein